MSIGFGIMCFGDDYYFRGAKEKFNRLSEYGECYVLTDKKKEFVNYVHSENILNYPRLIPSYHDKMLLAQHILKFHDICILIDADVHIFDYSFLKDLMKWTFRLGISYIDTLENHPEKKAQVGDLNLFSPEWNLYSDHTVNLVKDLRSFPLIWEYFLIFNREGGHNMETFFKHYQKLQIVKEYSDLILKKDIIGNGEGISIQIAAELSGTFCRRDIELFDLLKTKMSSFSRKFMRPEFRPTWMNDNQ